MNSTMSRRQTAPALPAEQDGLDELLSLASRLEESNQELEQFAAVASHDLQEPLRKIQAFGSLLMTRYGDLIGESGRHYLECMETASLRMQALIEDMLTLARIPSSARPFTDVDLEETAREVVLDLELAIDQSGARIEITDLPTVTGDPSQLRQVLHNLIGNALKFSRQEALPVVKLFSRPSGGSGNRSGAGAAWCIFVEDNGIGFEPAHAERIFQAFERLHGPHEYEGTGMGLAICKKIAKRHGGDVTAMSTPGRGSKFIVTLPV